MKGLNKLYWLKKDIEQIENQISELTVIKAAAISSIPSGNSVSSPVERFVEKAEKLQEKLTKKLQEYIAERERIEDYIEGIKPGDIRTIARMRFIDNLDWQTIGDTLNMDRTTAYKKLKKYLEEN